MFEVMHLSRRPPPLPKVVHAFSYPRKKEETAQKTSFPQSPNALSSTAVLEKKTSKHYPMKNIPSSSSLPNPTPQALFLKTLLPAAGAAASTIFAAVTFFAAALTPAAFFAAAGGLPDFFTTVVPVDVPDAVLELLTVLLVGFTTDTAAFAVVAPFLERVLVVLGSRTGLETFLAGARVGFSFSPTRAARLDVVVAARAATLAGEVEEVGLRGILGFSGEKGRVEVGF